MKITEEKHNHKLTNLLKVFIFSVLMILPFLNVAVRCGYVMLNKNAYQSYYGETINQVEYNYLENFNDYTPSNNYLFTLQTQLNITNKSGKITYFTNANVIDTNVNDFNISLYNSFTVSKDTTYTYIVFYGDNIENKSIYSGQRLQFSYELVSFNTVDLTFTEAYDHLIQKIEYNNYSYLDNVFEYSIDKLQEEQYLTWTQNTAVYQGVETMTTQLGITQTVIPMLIVYWFMLTIIYVIIDIVLALFTKLTHMIGNKTT